jgi:lysine 2,3-aminomutase
LTHQDKILGFLITMIKREIINHCDTAHDFNETQLNNSEDYRQLLPCFKDVMQEQWDDWQWQRDNSLIIEHSNSPETKKQMMQRIAEIVGLPMEDFASLERVLKSWNVMITPHQALQIRHQLAKEDRESAMALFKIVEPSVLESQHQPTVVKIKTDGLGTGYRRAERYDTPENPQPSVIRRLYDDRAILAPTFECPTICRYCFRRNEAARSKETNWQEGLDYIEKWNETHQTAEKVKDIIISGGDPLSLSDDKLKKLLSQAKTIDGVKIIRIDTKYPTAMPQRITPELAKILGDYVHFMCLHTTHPAELSSETQKACLRLAEKGIILRSYIPLLKGVNDSRKILKELFWKSFADCKVSPYYLVHFIETLGGQHFKVPLEEALRLMGGLQTELSGPVIPQLVVYLPEGAGKFVFGVNRTSIKRTREGYWLPSPLHKGKPTLYPDPIPDNQSFEEFEF